MNLIVNDQTFHKDKIKIFVSRYPSINATSWQDGTILLNIGLLSRLENEHQLAFVIAHEISHYAKQHGYRQYAEFLKNKAAYSDFVTTLKYGLQYEFEADEMALTLLKKGRFDMEESLAVLDIIQGKRERNIIDFYKYFESSRFKVTSKHRCDAISRHIELTDQELVLRQLSSSQAIRGFNSRTAKLYDKKL